MQYVPVDGEHELLPGLRLVPAPGHTPGMQMVVVETGGRPFIVGGDVAVWFGEFDEPPTEGRQRVLALDPELSGSRTSASHGDPPPSKASRRRSLGLPGFPLMTSLLEGLRHRRPLLGTGFGDRFGSSQGCSGSLKERTGKDHGTA